MIDQEYKDMFFTHDYLTYDKYGLAEMRCMASNVPIKSRMEEVSKKDPSRLVYVLGKHSNYCEIPVLMEDHSVAFLVLSKDYKDIPIETEEAKLISQQLLRAKRMELEDQKWPEDVIEAVLFNMEKKKKVLRRLTPQEIKQKFGGE